MDTVIILRELWRLRRFVVGVAVLAVLAGMVVLYQVPNFESRQYEVGIATTSILLDTPNSQVVDVAPKGSGTLGLRANLLASLMVDGVVKTAIAQGAGLNPNDLAGTSTSVTDQPVTQPKDPRAPVLTTQVVTDNNGGQLPIINVQAQAHDAAAAMRLANASVVGLRDYLDSKAATEQIPDAQRLQVTGLGVPQAHTATRGPSDILAVAAVIFVFGLGCMCILGIRALARGWRAASVREQLGDDGQPTADVEPTPDERFLDEVPQTLQTLQTLRPPPHAPRPAAESTSENWHATPPRPDFVRHLRRHDQTPVKRADDDPRVSRA